MSAHIPDSHDAHEGWRDCQGGEISLMVERSSLQKVRVSRRKWLAASSMAVGVLLMAGVLSLTGNKSSQRISCKEVFALDVQYVKHELSPEMQARIKSHLAACPKCEVHMHEVEQALGITASRKRQAAPDSLLADVSFVSLSLH